MNKKYDLNFEDSLLDSTNLENNSWFTGMIDSDGYFGININEAVPKSETRKRSRSFNVELRFYITHRSFDRSTSSSMNSIMDKISTFLSCNLKESKINPNLNLKLETINYLVCEIAALNKIEVLTNYLDRYPLLGLK